jgi:catechol 2,3-dioxygenase-like lactoylglutathione lyase family enzyme
MSRISGPDFITLLVSDLAVSHDFYRNKLGLPESSEKQPNAHAFSTKPCGFAIRLSAKARRIDAATQGIILWLRTTDATALHAELIGRGISIVDDLRESPFGRTFSFKDPDGYVLTVHDGG